MDDHPVVDEPRVLSIDEFAALVARLGDDSRPVIGPTVIDGVISQGEIRSVDDLPRGWRDHQEPGRYRLERSGDEFFGFAAPSTSFKPHLMPEPTLLIRASRSDTGSITIDEPSPDPAPAILLGVRGCDLAAMGVLDHAVGANAPEHNAAVDPTYAERRDSAFIVAVACGSPASTCFCASMGTGPTPTSGFDLLVHEVNDREGHRFVVTAGSAEGVQVLVSVPGMPASAGDVAATVATHQASVAAMARSIDSTDPGLAASVPDDPHWADIASRCLSCANCTLVCPTCFCSTTYDTTDLTGATAERWRSWDSCFTNDFSAIHGGAVRDSTESRYRQWLLHKLDRWHDQFGSSGCVGCGRCIAWCPVGIDITAEVAALADAARSTGKETAP